MYSGREMAALLQTVGVWVPAPTPALSPLQTRRLCRAPVLSPSGGSPLPPRSGLKMKLECVETLHDLLNYGAFRSEAAGQGSSQSEINVNSVEYEFTGELSKPVPWTVISRHGIPQGCTDIDAGKVQLICPTFEVELLQNWCTDNLLPALISFPAILILSGSARAEVLNPQINQIYGDLGDGIEIGAQVLYLAALLGLVGVASYFVVRQVLIRRDLESAARDLQDRVRTGEAMPVEYFELGAVMLRKKFYPLASKYLEQAIAKWDGDPQDLAQVHNALGFSYVNDNVVDRGIAEYQKAVKLQPGYVTAWNNLGSAYEKKKNLSKALEAYEQALRFDPNNGVAREYRDALKKRVERLEGVPIKND